MGLKYKKNLFRKNYTNLLSNANTILYHIY